MTSSEGGCYVAEEVRGQIWSKEQLRGVNTSGRMNAGTKSTNFNLTSACLEPVMRKPQMYCVKSGSTRYLLTTIDLSQLIASSRLG